MYRSRFHIESSRARLGLLGAVVLAGVSGLLPGVAAAQVLVVHPQFSRQHAPAIVHDARSGSHRVLSHNFPSNRPGYGTVHRGPLGFETHHRIRAYEANRRQGHAATSAYNPGCRIVYKESHVNGRPATVSGQMCYDEYGETYIVPNSRQLVEYHNY